MKNVFLTVCFSIIYLLSFGQQVPLDNRVVTGKLSNGLTYYIVPNKKPENKVELQLVVNAGSVLENDDQQGLAHFCEHMAFNGTVNFKKNELVDYLQSAGVKFGAHINAYTSFDETVYMLSLPTENKEVVDKGFQILEDWAHGLLFDPEEIEKERGVVLEEYRIGLGASKRMMTEYIPKLLYKSKYADRLPIGKKEVLENFKPEALTSFYQTWYRPDLMAVIVVGDIDVEEAKNKIEAHFASLKNPPKSVLRPTIEVPDHKETFVSKVTDPEATYGSISVAYKLSGPYVLKGDEASFSEAIKQQLFYSMLNYRLRELAKKPQAGFTQAYVYQDELWVRSKEAVQAFAIVGNGNYSEALRSLAIEIERARLYGFTDSELSRAKENLRTRFERAIKEKDKTESRSIVSNLVSYFLTNSSMPSPEWSMQKFETVSKDVNTKSFQTLIAQFAQKQNRVISITGPTTDKDKMPSDQEVISILEDFKGIEIKPIVELELPSRFIQKIPPMGLIAEKKDNAENNTHAITLSNGIRILYMPTEFKNDEILFSALSEGGTNNLPDPVFKAVRNGLSVISQTGVGAFSDSDVEKMLAGKSVRVTPYISSVTEGFSGSCRPQDMETLFELVNLYFTQPRFDMEAYQSYVSKQRSFYDNMEANPSSYFSIEFNKWIHDNHPRSYVAPKQEDWEMTDYNQIHAVFKERFANPADFTFVFVGNIPVDSFTYFARSYLGSLQTSSTREKTQDVGYKMKTEKDRFSIHRGSEPKSTVQIVFSKEIPYSKKDDLLLDMAAELLTIKLVEVLREEMSGVYGTSARNSFSRLPNGSFTFTIGFPCGPENVDALIDAAIKELNKLALSGPEQKDVEKVQQTMIKSLSSDVQNNRFWLNQLAQWGLYGDVIGSKQAMEKEILSITGKNIQTAVQMHLQGNYQIGILYPEDK